MYTVKTTQHIEIATEIHGDRMHLDVLLATATELRELLESHLDINVEDLDAAHWEIKGWPTDSDPEHLVITLLADPKRRIVRG